MYQDELFTVEIPASGIPLSKKYDFENVWSELEDDEEIDDGVNDGDFVYKGLEEEEEEEEDDDLSSRPGSKSGRRGPDLQWDLCATFNLIDELKESDIYKELNEFSRRSGKATSRETYHVSS